MQILGINLFELYCNECLLQNVFVADGKDFVEPINQVLKDIKSKIRNVKIEIESHDETNKDNLDNNDVHDSISEFDDVSTVSNNNKVDFINKNNNNNDTYTDHALKDISNIISDYIRLENKKQKIIIGSID